MQGQSQLRDAVISKNFCSCIRETDERTRRKDRKEVRVMAKQIIRKEIPSSETRKTTQYEYVIEYGEKVE